MMNNQRVCTHTVISTSKRGTAVHRTLWGILMVTKGNKKVLGGSWLLLTLLMIGMSWAQAVPPAGDVASTTSVDETEASNAVDMFALNVEEIAKVDYTAFGYADEDELVGSRTATSKTYVTDEGKVAIVATDPIHYLDDQGVWQEIDLNVNGNSQMKYVQKKLKTSTNKM